MKRVKNPGKDKNELKLVSLTLKLAISIMLAHETTQLYWSHQEIDRTTPKGNYFLLLIEGNLDDLLMLREFYYVKQKTNI